MKFVSVVLETFRGETQTNTHGEANCCIFVILQFSRYSNELRIGQQKNSGSRPSLDFSLFHSVQTDSEAHAVSYSTIRGGSVHTDKAAGA
jgi:hypothetical protein